MTKENGPGGTLELIRRHLGKKHDLLLFRNQAGFVEETDEHSAQRYGLAPGASDLVGVLAPWGVFFALEVKATGKKPTAEQEQFLALIRKFGGWGGWADSVETAQAQYELARNYFYTTMKLENQTREPK